MKNIFYILLLLPTIIFAQYPSNSGQKITLGEQTTADGLVFRGLASDTTRKPSVDTMAFILLDTNTNIIWQYKKATNNAWTRLNLRQSDTTSFNYVNTYGTQTINGAKTFTNNTVFNGNLNIGSNLQSGANINGVYLDTRTQSGVTGNLIGFNSRMLGLQPVSGSYTIANMYNFRTQQPVIQSNVTVSNSYGVYISRTDDPSSGGVVTKKYALVTEDLAGNIGLGITNPGQRLVIKGRMIMFGGNDAVYFSSNGTLEDKWHFGVEGAAPNSTFSITQSGVATRLTVSNTGNVGIGQTTPTARLHVKGSGVDGNTTALKVDNNGNVNLLTILDNGATTFTGSVTANSLSLTTPLSVANGGTNRTTMPAGYILHGDGTSVDTSSQLFWDRTNDRLGVGTVAPSTTFQVTGTTTFRNNTPDLDNSILGDELLTSSNWTTTGWTGNFTSGFTHSTGNTNILSNTFAAVINKYYSISYTVTNRTAGSFVISFGGYTSGNLTATNSVGPIATTIDNLNITPTSDFNGTIILSIKEITSNNPSIQFLNSAGVVTNEIRISNRIRNTFIGFSAGSKNLNFLDTRGAYNTFIGSQAGQNNTTGNENTFIGSLAGRDMTIGSGNSFFGYSSGRSSTFGFANSFFGTFSGANNTTGFNNIFFGNSAGINNTTGSTNTFLGVSAGQANTTGSNNTYIGIGSGANSTTGSGNFVAGNSINLPTVSTSDFVSIKNIIFATGASGTGTTIAGSVGIGTNAPTAGYRLTVADSVYVGGRVSAAGYTTRSDYNLKDEIQSINYGLNEVLQMQPVKYTYKSNGEQQLGFIAQDIGTLIPESVHFDEFMGVDYQSIIPILTKAIQEQQTLIKALEQRILILENK